MLLEIPTEVIVIVTALLVRPPVGE